MRPRELLLLSPYRLPTRHTVTLGDDEVAAFLNGYTALWHPAAAGGAAAPPRVASQYDHEQPSAGFVYAVPEAPPLFLPEDWEQRVRDAGAAAFRATADRAETLANLRRALGEDTADVPIKDDIGRPAGPWEWPDEQVAPFLGVGFGYLVVESLFEAMDHPSTIAAGEIWDAVREAAAAFGQGDGDGARARLQGAADRLLAAREQLYPVAIHLIDLHLPGDSPAEFLAEVDPAREAPLNAVTPGSLLERLAHETPDHLAALRERVREGRLEVCGGCYVEREDSLLPVESQLWNLLKGLQVARDALGADVRVFARRRFGFDPCLPILLARCGLRRALLVAFDDAAVPSHRSPVVHLPAGDGEPLEAFARAPYPAAGPHTYFHLAHYLHETIMQDHAATLALLHRGEPAAPWYRDWLELSRLAPVLGQWTTLSNYFNAVPAGEHADAATPDDYHFDFLSERVDRKARDPVSGLGRHARARRRLDTAWTLAALQRGVAGASDPLRLEGRLADLEDRLEGGGDADADLGETLREVGEVLAGRLLARARAEAPGYLVLNPCGFARRVPLEWQGVSGPLPVAGPLKACQVEGERARLVVEVPALGFAWIPRLGPPGTAPQPVRMRLADGHQLRNEFFEAEVDPATGGLRGIWDHRRRVSRLGQQVIYNPGSSMRAAEVRVTSSGPALGEIVSEGAIFGTEGEVLATFRQRFRAWLGRPVLDLRIEIYPEQPPEGYAWHSYYAARFAWRDKQAALLRGVNGTAHVTSQTRPLAPDFLELRQGRGSTAIFPGGLPFHQRHGGRMLDVLLVPPGETCQVFDLAIGLDRDYPVQTALGLVTPVPTVEVAQGPPYAGAAGWLFHLDAPQLLLTSMRPLSDGADGLSARLLECGGVGGPAELRCARDPRRAEVLDLRGERLRDGPVSGDAARFEAPAGDLFQLRLGFGQP